MRINPPDSVFNQNEEDSDSESTLSTSSTRTGDAAFDSAEDSHVSAELTSDMVLTPIIGSPLFFPRLLTERGSPRRGVSWAERLETESNGVVLSPVVNKEREQEDEPDLFWRFEQLLELISRCDEQAYIRFINAHFSSESGERFLEQQAECFLQAFFALDFDKEDSLEKRHAKWLIREDMLLWYLKYFHKMHGESNSFYRYVIDHFDEEVFFYFVRLNVKEDVKINSERYTALSPIQCLIDHLIEEEEVYSQWMDRYLEQCTICELESMILHIMSHGDAWLDVYVNDPAAWLYKLFNLHANALPGEFTFSSRLLFLEEFILGVALPLSESGGAYEFLAEIDFFSHPKYQAMIRRRQVSDTQLSSCWNDAPALPKP